MIEEAYGFFSPYFFDGYKRQMYNGILYSNGIRVSELTGMNINDADLISKSAKI
jgi:site-specific recombinase XerC